MCYNGREEATFVVFFSTFCTENPMGMVIKMIRFVPEEMAGRFNFTHATDITDRAYYDVKFGLKTGELEFVPPGLRTLDRRATDDNRIFRLKVCNKTDDSESLLTKMLDSAEIDVPLRHICSGSPKISNPYLDYRKVISGETKFVENEWWDFNGVFFRMENFVLEFQRHYTLYRQGRQPQMLKVVIPYPTPEEITAIWVENNLKKSTEALLGGVEFVREFFQGKPYVVIGILNPDPTVRNVAEYDEYTHILALSSDDNGKFTVTVRNFLPTVITDELVREPLSSQGIFNHLNHTYGVDRFVQDSLEI